MEWLLAAESSCRPGNTNVILCERGIAPSRPRPATRSTCRPVPSSLPDALPIIVDPSHGQGHRDLVSPMALAGAAVGADGPDHRGTSGPGQRPLGRRPEPELRRVRRLMDECARLQFVRAADAQQTPAAASAATGDIEEVRNRIDDLDARLAEMVQDAPRSPSTCSAGASQLRTAHDAAASVRCSSGGNRDHRTDDAVELTMVSMRCSAPRARSSDGTRSRPRNRTPPPNPAGDAASTTPTVGSGQPDCGAGSRVPATQSMCAPSAHLRCPVGCPTTVTMRATRREC